MRTTYTYDFNDTLNPITSYNQNSANTGSKYARSLTCGNLYWAFAAAAKLVGAIHI